ncbi:MAG: tetratricopeptide repeat protein [Candidatus Binatia bacterium]
MQNPVILKQARRGHSGLLCIVLIALLVQSCAPARPYRMPPRATGPTSPSPSAGASKSPASESKPVPEQSRVKETELGNNRSGPGAGKGQTPNSPLEREAPAALADDSSLLAKIGPRTSPQRAASIRLTEEGRKLLEAEEYGKALSRLERSITIDSSNPYAYYYLGKAHHKMGRHREALNFLEVAESSFAAEPYWLSETLALKGDNFRALGMSQRAEASYAHALRLNSGNGTAIEGLNRLPGSRASGQR